MMLECYLTLLKCYREKTTNFGKYHSFFFIFTDILRPFHDNILREHFNKKSEKIRFQEEEKFVK
jgi:hypothetical protein